jgi:translocation and assembly module TamB
VQPTISRSEWIFLAEPGKSSLSPASDDAGVSESRALGGTVVGIGKYLSPRLYVSYGVSLLGTGQVITLKYLLRKGFDIEIESSTVENRGSVNWRKEK